MQIRAWNWQQYAQRSTEPGDSPGTLVPRADAQPPRLAYLRYGPGLPLLESADTDLATLRGLAGGPGILWLDIEGLGDGALLEAVGALFGLHPLALADVVNVPQRPKAEVYGEQVFIVARMPAAALPLDSEQVSLFLGPNFVITFGEKEGDVFGPVRQRIRDGRPGLLEGGADYLAYSLIDAIVDAYFPLLESYGEFLEDLEEEILMRPRQELVPRLHHLKRDLLNLRRYVWPLRELLAALHRDEIPRIAPATRLYLRDSHDHAVQVMELLESYRDMASSLMDLYLSSVSHRLNEVMKVLTIIATLFMPLSFIAGVYGMNFDRGHPWNMPELGWRLGYLFALGLMAAVALVMLTYFWRKGWFGGDHGDRENREG
jgi:magnesium transporter